MLAVVAAAAIGRSCSAGNKEVVVVEYSIIEPGICVAINTNQGEI